MYLVGVKVYNNTPRSGVFDYIGEVMINIEQIVSIAALDRRWEHLNAAIMYNVCMSNGITYLIDPESANILFSIIEQHSK